MSFMLKSSAAHMPQSESYQHAYVRAGQPSLEINDDKEGYDWVHSEKLHWR
jgi:hypothetical protein